MRLVDEALAIASATDYLDWQGQAYGVRGLVLDGAGRGDEARAAYGQALDLFEAQRQRGRGRSGAGAARNPRSAD